MTDRTDTGGNPPQDVFAEEHRVPTAEREARNGHRGGVLWLTGLSGAGKSTLAFSLDEALFADGYHTFVLDGDNMRRGINADLGFSPSHRSENIRRVGEVAALFAASGTICISAFISPYRAHRAAAREAAGNHFHEIYVRAALATCERRDPKRLYERARAGEIANFTGIDDPYEAPDSPELVVDTDVLTVEESVAKVRTYVHREFSLR